MDASSRFWELHAGFLNDVVYVVFLNQQAIRTFLVFDAPLKSHNTNDFSNLGGNYRERQTK